MKSWYGPIRDRLRYNEFYWERDKILVVEEEPLWHIRAAQYWKFMEHYSRFVSILSQQTSMGYLPHAWHWVGFWDYKDKHVRSLHSTNQHSTLANTDRVYFRMADEHRGEVCSSGLLSGVAHLSENIQLVPGRVVGVTGQAKDRLSLQIEPISLFYGEGLQFPGVLESWGRRSEHTQMLGYIRCYILKLCLTSCSSIPPLIQ